MNTKPIVDNGYMYYYYGYMNVWNKNWEQTRILYNCIGHQCRAALWKVTPWPEVTDEPPWIELQGTHTHPPLRDLMYPYPFPSLQEYQKYLSLYNTPINLPTPLDEQPPVSQTQKTGRLIRPPPLM